MSETPLQYTLRQIHEHTFQELQPCSLLEPDILNQLKFSLSSLGFCQAKNWMSCWISSLVVDLDMHLLTAMVTASHLIDGWRSTDVILDLLDDKHSSRFSISSTKWGVKSNKCKPIGKKKSADGDLLEKDKKAGDYPLTNPQYHIPCHCSHSQGNRGGTGVR